MGLKELILKLWLRLFPKCREEGPLNKDLSGLKKDKPDDRDYKSEMITEEIPETEMPKFAQLAIDPYKYVKNQGSWSSCASHVMAIGLEISHELEETNKAGVELAERHHYFWARKLNGKFPQNKGMTMRDMLKVAQRRGICPEKLCPYISNKMNDSPGVFTDSFAKWWRVEHYWRVADLKRLKEVILDRRWVALGVYINASLKRYDGPIEVKKGERLYGGHGILVYGYDDVNQELLCINSWSRRYKDKGIMRLPYEYFNKYRIDSWMCTIVN